MSKIAKRFATVHASLEAEQLDAFRQEALSGDLSEDALQADEAGEEQIDQAVQLVEVINDAKCEEADAREVRDIAADAMMIRENIDLVNANGGVSTESLHFSQLALDAALAPTGRRVVLSVESFDDIDAGGKSVISIECVDAVQKEIDTVRSDVEAHSVDAVLRV